MSISVLNCFGESNLFFSVVVYTDSGLEITRIYCYIIYCCIHAVHQMQSYLPSSEIIFFFCLNITEAIETAYCIYFRLNNKLTMKNVLKALFSVHLKLIKLSGTSLLVST